MLVCACSEEDTDDLEHATLNKNNPIAEFLRQNKGLLKGMSQEEFKAKYDQYVVENTPGEGSSPKGGGHKRQSSQEYLTSLNGASMITPGHLTSIVLKFTTLSESNEAPSFTLGARGGRIGKGPGNEVSIPSDTRLAAVGHAQIEYSNGSFYLIDGGHDFGASIRISVGVKKKQWTLDIDSRFSIGNSVFRSSGGNSEGQLVLECLEGPLKGERKLIPRRGATLGRSSDNTLSIPDRELSRRHSRIEYDENAGKFFVCDIGSTNGTYMQLVGPYKGRYKLSLNDHILVGRTGFSVNRYDYGLSEEMGHRNSMEDSCAIVQHLNIVPLSNYYLAPQSFFGVYDGHGGSHASIYLSQNLHVNVVDALTDAAPELLQIIEEATAAGAAPLTAAMSASGGPPSKDKLDRLVIQALKSSFLKTDFEFIGSSDHPQSGSTATTVLLLGRRLYCANTGDSRTVLSRNFEAVPMSLDHKPSREDESKRIREAGGFVINNRVMGELAVSRAFGDAEFKKGIKSIIEEEGVGLSGGSTAEEQKSWDQPLIIAEPDVEVCVCVLLCVSVCVCLSVCCVCCKGLCVCASMCLCVCVCICLSVDVC
jgi:serine/threonine protein phosphatase PrpC